MITCDCTLLFYQIRYVAKDIKLCTCNHVYIYGFNDYNCERHWKNKRSYIYGHLVKYEIIYILNPCCVDMRQLKICSQDVT
jgi:hypothetical protein